MATYVYILVEARAKGPFEPRDSRSGGQHSEGSSQGAENDGNNSTITFSGGNVYV